MTIPRKNARKKALNKKQVHAHRRVQAGQGALAKAKKDAEKEWIVWDADPAELEEIFGGGADGET